MARTSVNGHKVCHLVAIASSVSSCLFVFLWFTFTAFIVLVACLPTFLPLPPHLINPLSFPHSFCAIFSGQIWKPFEVLSLWQLLILRLMRSHFATHFLLCVTWISSLLHLASVHIPFLCVIYLSFICMSLPVGRTGCLTDSNTFSVFLFKYHRFRLTNNKEPKSDPISLQVAHGIFHLVFGSSHPCNRYFAATTCDFTQTTHE